MQGVEAGGFAEFIFGGQNIHTVANVLDRDAAICKLSDIPKTQGPELHASSAANV